MADMPLSGNQVETTLGTYDYQPGSTDKWEVLVFDTEGNRTITPRAPLTCAIGYNQAPIPHIRISKTKILVGESITLDATSSYDPDGSASQLSVEWDLDGDNVFDTVPSTIKTHVTSYSKPGVYQIVAGLTDGEDSASHSIPIGIRVELLAPPIDVNINIYPKTLNLKSRGKRIIIKIRLPKEYDPHDIARDSLELSIPSCLYCEVIYPTSEFPLCKYYLAFFPRQYLIDEIEIMNLDLPAKLDLKIAGELNDGTPFEGLDTIRVLKRKKEQKRK